LTLLDESLRLDKVLAEEKQKILANLKHKKQNHKQFTPAKIYVHDIVNLPDFVTVTNLYRKHFDSLISLGIFQVAYTPKNTRIYVMHREMFDMFLDFCSILYSDVVYQGSQQGYSVKRWHNPNNPYVRLGLAPALNDKKMA